MFFRKGGTASAILSLALLVAIQASMNCFVNQINSQAEDLGSKVSVGKVYLVLERNSTAITDSEVERKLADLLRSIDGLVYVLPERLLVIPLTVNFSRHFVTVRSVEDVYFFLNLRRARLRGGIARANALEVDVGQLLARFASINVNDELTLNFAGMSVKVRVAGIFETSTQSDAELLIPMEILDRLIGESGKVSLIEFSLKGGESEEGVVSRLREVLPQNVKVEKVQDPIAFVQAMNGQTSSFLEAWSSIVFMVTAAASYIVASRLIAEGAYEFTMLRALGAKRRMLFTLVSAYMLIVAFLGAIIGLSLGVFGAKIASTTAMWMKPGLEVFPFIKVEQSVKIVALTLIMVLLGSSYPSLKSAFKKETEETL